MFTVNVEKKTYQKTQTIIFQLPPSNSKNRCGCSEQEFSRNKIAELVNRPKRECSPKFDRFLSR